MKETSGGKKYVHDQPLTPGEKFTYGTTLVVMMASFFTLIYAFVEPNFRSEERQAELDAAAATAQATREAEWNQTIEDRAVELVGEVVYVQDSRTGVCFATRSAFRLGHLAEVDCEKIPATLLLKTE